MARSNASRIAGRLAAIVTGQPRAVEATVATYTERMSVAFQIIDDVLDIEHSLGRAGEFGKAFGNDIREGKTTLLVIHAMTAADPERAAQLESILADTDPSDEAVREAIAIIQETDSIEYSRETAYDLAEEARDTIAALDLAPAPAEKLADFPRFMIEREV